MVVWQRDREGGGEFGIQFTALDSASVEALKALCGLRAVEASAEPTADALSPEASAAAAAAGMAVKLHIDGLGAPMKARVRIGGSRRLQVGSNLEFLKVGRGLQIEDVEQGQRRGARIDSGSIAIDPQTQVPQPVVALRYEGEDTTPEPSVIGADDAEGRAAGAASDQTTEAAGPASAGRLEGENEDEDEDEQEVVAAAM